jgi:hypothetical protein
MQHFDGEIEKLIRNDVVDFETALTYSTNAGNLRLELADYLEGGGSKKKPAAEIEIER